jgi:hypothetical protein
MTIQQTALEVEEAETSEPEPIQQPSMPLPEFRNNLILDEDHIPPPNRAVGPKDPGVSVEVWNKLLLNADHNKRNYDISFNKRAKARTQYENTMRFCIRTDEELKSLENKPLSQRSPKSIYRAQLDDAIQERNRAIAEFKKAAEAYEQLVNEARREADRELLVYKKLDYLMACPEGYSWIRIVDGYRCAGGLHWMSILDVNDFQLP